MDVPPIKTEADFHTALAEIERLWDAEPDTPEGDRLDILMTLVEVYERRHHPMPPANPIAAIEFMMEQRGMTRAAGADHRLQRPGVGGFEPAPGALAVAAALGTRSATSIRQKGVDMPDGFW